MCPSQVPSALQANKKQAEPGKGCMVVGGLAVAPAKARTWVHGVPMRLALYPGPLGDPMNVPTLCCLSSPLVLRGRHPGARKLSRYLKSCKPPFRIERSPRDGQLGRRCSVKGSNLGGPHASPPKKPSSLSSAK